ncbi:MAG: hypothetical protein DI604_20385 [Delftia acidovorans]|nr:MAG: hypothetical protein DI604_20385 [Delftia acidovorans]
MTDIFLSHAVADRHLAELLVDFLVDAIGVPASEIFCSSMPGFGVPLTHDFNEAMRDRIQDPKLVILLMTPSYMDSLFCMMEVGATWALGLRPLPIVVPPVSFADITRTLGLRQGWDITNSEMLQGVRETVLKTLTIAGTDNYIFDRKRNRWLADLPGAMRSLAASPKINREDLQRVASERDDWKARAESSRTENLKLRRDLKALERLRPVALIIESEPLIALDIQQIFEKQGYVVAGVAKTEIEAVELARHIKPDIITAEIALSDGSSGLNAVERIQEFCLGLPVFVTAYPDRLLSRKNLSLAWLVAKPFDPIALIKAISEAHAWVIQEWDRKQMDAHENSN